MKKIILFICMSAAALPGAAQRNWFKFFRKPAAPVAAPLTLRSVQGKKLPVTTPFVSPRQLELENLIARPVVLSPSDELVFATTPHSLAQRVSFGVQYQEVMNKFQKFKKETTPFLYYRLKEPKGSDVLISENSALSALAFDMDRSLQRLRVVVDAEYDAPLAFAIEYVNRVREELNPFLKGMLDNPLEFIRTDRTFVGDEFYLHNVEYKRWLNMLRYGQAQAQANLLPPGLRVAVLNDRPSVLEQMTKSHEKGVFIRGGTLECFSRAEEVLAAVHSGKKYDVILTDIVVPGGGGYYLTVLLRSDGFEGAIIALSAFERDDSMGAQMFKVGFDGMINLPIAFEHSPFWQADVMRGLNRYFNLRDENNWQR